MNTISERDYILSQPDMTEDDYNHWQKLMRAMTTSARMMGLKDNAMTRQVFNTALLNLMNFEKSITYSFMSWAYLLLMLKLLYSLCIRL